MTFKYKISSPYGNRFIFGENQFHKGIDIVYQDNDNVISFTDGTVGVSTIIPKSSGNNTWQWGNYVRVDGSDGLKYYYCHMASRKVQVGQKIKTGDILGISGSTGLSTGKHTHFEIRNTKGTSLDPTNILKQIPNLRGIYDYVISEEKSEETNMAEITYTVVRGDTLSKIAAKYKTTYIKLAQYNNIKSPSSISVGQKIKIPNIASAIAPTVPNPKPVKPVETVVEYPIIKELGNGDCVMISEHIVMADLKCEKSTGWFINCLNGTFFNRATGKVASIMAIESYGKLRKINEWACHQWCGFPEGVLVAYKDGTFDTLRIKGLNEIKKPYIFAIGGVSLLDKYNPSAEGFKSGIVFQGKPYDFSDVLRKTSHAVIGVDKDGLVHGIYVDNKSASEVNKLCKSLGLVNAVMMDGGSIGSINTEKFKKNIYTKQSNIIQFIK
ncbi:MAG: Peptidase [Clostridiales bacterium]|jgi:murein DD-endopeptidase MepM/ murein hydrolase activator NlpD|nr:Peptidase [Clostridiales bacterium]